MSLNDFILNCEKDNKELRKDIEYYKNKNKRLQQENQKLKKQLEVGEEQYNDLVEEKEKYKETVDKAIHLLDQFDAWLEPQDFLKIKKIEKVLEEVK